MTDEIGTVRWFGVTWGAPINDPRAEIPTPVGSTCGQCLGEIQDGHRGMTIPSVENGQVTEVPYHRHCFMEMVGLVSPLAQEHYR